jgi:hypothetical protein
MTMRRVESAPVADTAKRDMPDVEASVSPAELSTPTEVLTKLAPVAERVAIATIARGEQPDWPALDLTAITGATEGARPVSLDLSILRHTRLAEWITQIGEAHRVTTAMALLGLLVTAAAALGAQVMARVTATWQVRPILWGLIISEPGLRKSPLLEFLTKLLDPIQDAETQRWEASVAEAEADKAGIDESWRTFRREQRLAERQDRPDPARPARDAGSVVVPIRPGLVLQDPSIEAAMELAAGSPRGLVAMPDEAAALLAARNGASARSRWLQAAGGRSISIERISRPSRKIESFAISVLTGTQPDLLKTLIGPADDGFLARFLCLWPEALPKAGIWRGAVDVDGIKTLIAALRQAGDTQSPISISLTDEALDRLDASMAAWEDIADRMGGIVAGFYRKADAHAVRIALVLAALRSAADKGEVLPDAITLPDIEVGIRLVNEVFATGIHRVAQHLKRSAGETMAMTLLSHLQRTHMAFFNARQLRREYLARFGDQGAYAAAVEELVHAGIIRRAERASGTTGRSRGDYEVHPSLISQPALT